MAFPDKWQLSSYRFLSTEWSFTSDAGQMMMKQLGCRRRCWPPVCLLLSLPVMSVVIGRIEAFPGSATSRISVCLCFQVNAKATTCHGGLPVTAPVSHCTRHIVILLFSPCGRCDHLSFSFPPSLFLNLTLTIAGIRIKCRLNGKLELRAELLKRGGWRGVEQKVGISLPVELCLCVCSHLMRLSLL